MRMIQNIFKAVLFFGIFLGGGLLFASDNLYDRMAWEFDLPNVWETEKLSSPEDQLFLQAIVYPETVRFSRLRDQMEITGLIFLYNRFGKDYSDFSVGLFQMKPSFIERLEEEVKASSKVNALFPDIPLSHGTEEENKTEQEERQQRISRIVQPQWQYRYLRAFYHLMEERYSDKQWASIEEKLCFYAAAYNRGFWESEEVIARASGEARFYTTFFKRQSPEMMIYSEVALAYYKNQRSLNEN